MKSKKTKKALTGSVLALVLCFVMLLGTTFAWFTDTASTNVSSIQAGNLDVVLEKQVSENTWQSIEGEVLNFLVSDANENKTPSASVLWEPGCTFELPKLRVRNEGNLALKYKIVFSAVVNEGHEGGEKLAEVLEVYVGGQSTGETLKSVLESKDSDGVLYGNLLGKDKTDTVDGKALSDTSAEYTVSLHMKESAGNEYKGLTIDGVAVTVYATQWTYEYDSNNNQYDAGATLPDFKAQSELTAALTAEGTDPVNVALGAGTYTLPAVSNKTVTISGTKDTVIDMTGTGGMTSAGVSTAGLDITFNGVTVKFANADYQGIQHSKSVVYENCVLVGRQTMYADDVEFINCTFINSADYAVWTYGSDNATFENCTFYSGGKAILIYCEDAAHTNNVTVNNCVFNDNNSLNTAKAAIEIGDSQDTLGLHVNLTATNNTINGFANNDEGTATGNKMWGNKNSIPADRLNVTASNNTENDATVVVSNSATEVANALKATTKTIDVTLTGDVAMDISTLDGYTDGSGQYKLGGADTTAINIDLGGHKLTLNTTYWSALGAKNSAATITVKNGSMNSVGNSANTWNAYDLTFYDCKWNFQDVTFDKAVALATGANTEMKNVTINETGDAYALWITADGQAVTLDNVTINCPNGRAIAIKDEYRTTTAQSVTLNISNSKFTSAKKAAVLVTSTAGATINASNVDITGVAADSTNLVWKDNGASYGDSVSVTITGGSAIVEP